MTLFKKSLIASILSAIFFALLFLVTELFFFDGNDGFSSFKTKVAFIDEDNNGEFSEIETSEHENFSSSDENMPQYLKKNIEQIKRIQQFNPKIKDAKQESSWHKKGGCNTPPKSYNKAEHSLRGMNDCRVSHAKATTTNRPNNKPKMVLIIDDVSFAKHVSMIKQVDLPITPSFLPPTKRHPFSPKLAQNFNDYMVHLPLEALNNHAIEENTLDTHDTIHKIMDTVMRVKVLFPKVKYINNHTGSKFTADAGAMSKLFRALDEHDIKFLDSKTTAQSQASKVAGYKILQRNIFLDHIDEEHYIKNQLKKAIRLAKKEGLAIVIGHPRKATMKVIREHTALIKREVNVISIGEV